MTTEHDINHGARCDCNECFSVRQMNRAEFKVWFSRKYDRPFCAQRPEHLVGSYAHQRDCEQR